MFFDCFFENKVIFGYQFVFFLFFSGFYRFGFKAYRGYAVVFKYMFLGRFCCVQGFLFLWLLFLYEWICYLYFRWSFIRVVFCFVLVFISFLVGKDKWYGFMCLVWGFLEDLGGFVVQMEFRLYKYCVLIKGLFVFGYVVLQFIVRLFSK